MRKQKYTILGTLLALSISGTSNASEVSCVVQPTCESLGYTQAASDCVNNNYTACPFDTAKVKCQQTKSCADLGYIYLSSTATPPCSSLVPCPYDSQWAMCNNNPKIGDIKLSLQTSDHNGWFKADGRVLNGAFYPGLANALGKTALPSITNGFVYWGGVNKAQQTILGLTGGSLNYIVLGTYGDMISADDPKIDDQYAYSESSSTDDVNGDGYIDKYHTASANPYKIGLGAYIAKFTKYTNTTGAATMLVGAHHPIDTYWNPNLNKGGTKNILPSGAGITAYDSYFMKTFEEYSVTTKPTSLLALPNDIKTRCTSFLNVMANCNGCLQDMFGATSAAKITLITDGLLGVIPSLPKKKHTGYVFGLQKGKTYCFMDASVETVSFANNCRIWTGSEMMPVYEYWEQAYASGDSIITEDNISYVYDYIKNLGDYNFLAAGGAASSLAKTIAEKLIFPIHWYCAYKVEIP